MVGQNSKILVHFLAHYVFSKRNIFPFLILLLFARNFYTAEIELIANFELEYVDEYSFIDCYMTIQQKYCQI